MYEFNIVYEYFFSPLVAPHSLQDFRSLTSNQIQGPGNESAESYPLDHQEVSSIFKSLMASLVTQM